MEVKIHLVEQRLANSGPSRQIQSTTWFYKVLWKHSHVLHLVCGSSGATTAKLNSCNRNYRGQKAKKKKKNLLSGSLQKKSTNPCYKSSPEFSCFFKDEHKLISNVKAKLKYPLFFANEEIKEKIVFVLLTDIQKIFLFSSKYFS